MSEQFATVGDVELCYETFGEPGDTPLLLVMGLGTQMIAWHDDFCAELAARDRFVVRYDNRDVGRSTHFKGVRAPSIAELLSRRPRHLAYTLEDMALDAAGLLDHLEIGSAHVVGASMGGMIAQTLAAHHSDRVRSLVSIMSSTGSRWTGQPAFSVYPFFMRRPRPGREAYVEGAVKLFAVVGSPGFPRDDGEVRDLAGRMWDRGVDTAGTARQLGAIVGAGTRTDDLHRITAPTLVIHGTKDRLIAPSGGRATARAIPGARLQMIEGMGHDLPRGAWPRVHEGIDATVARAAARRHAGVSSGGSLAAAEELAGQAAAAADAAEHNRRLPRELVAAIADAGLFRMLVPREIGGGEVEPAAMVDAIEALAGGDGAAAWCVAVAATSGMLAAYLPEEDAREIYGDAASIAGGVFAPRGRAVPEDGGYRVSGRWAFASGVNHSDWLMGGCLVEEDGAPRKLPGGGPDVRLILFPATEVEVIDTWTADGLRGTGSHDMAVDGAFAAAGRTASLLSDRPRADGPLYAFPVFGLLALAIAAVGLGIARAAIADLVDLAGAKTPTGSRRTLAERADAQARIAHATAGLDAARAYLHETVATAWEAAQDSGNVTLERRAALRLAASHAMETSAAAVDAMYALAGGTAVYADSPLQRRFRDIHVATQHMLVGPATWELAGRVLLGADTDASQL